MKFINLTNQTIVLNSGEEFPVSNEHPSAIIRETIGDFNEHGIAEVKVESMIPLPEMDESTFLIVPRPYAIELRKRGDTRNDIVCAATFHRATVRDLQTGQIISVPGFLRV